MYQMGNYLAGLSRLIAFPKNFMSRQILGSKIFGKKNWVQTSFEFKQVLCLKRFYVQKNVSQKYLGSIQKVFCVQKKWGPRYF